MDKETYILGPSHLHKDFLKQIEEEIKLEILFKNCILDGNRGLPNWSNYIPKTIEENQDKNMVWMVSDWKFNNFDYPEISKLKNSNNLFLDSRGYAYNVDKDFMESHHIETLGNHCLQVVDYIISIRPDIKLIFWCLYMRTRVNEKSSYPKHLWYDKITEKYKNNIIDIDLFSNPEDFLSKTLDAGGHPGKSGFELIWQMVKSEFSSNE